VSAPPWRIWIAEDAQRTMLAAAVAAHSRETGGVLLGVLTRGARPWVTQAVELPSSRSTATFYEVPAGARRKAVEKLRRQDPRLGYLGEWHVHPADLAPSTTDVSTMTRLAADPEGGCPRPVLIVVRKTRRGYQLDARQLSGSSLHALRIIATGPLPTPSKASAKKKTIRQRARRLYGSSR
jgi:hypothetical protein